MRVRRFNEFKNDRWNVPLITNKTFIFKDMSIIVLTILTFLYVRVDKIILHHM